MSEVSPGFSDDALATRRHARAVVQLGLVGIVGAATELDVVHRGLPTRGVGLDVMELQEPALCAAAPAFAGEGAATAVSEPHRPPEPCREVPRGRGVTAAGAWPRGGGELLPGQVIEQRGEGSIEDLRHVAVGNGMPQQVLRQAQLLARLGAGGEADLVPIRGEGAGDLTTFHPRQGQGRREWARRSRQGWAR